MTHIATDISYVTDLELEVIIGLDGNTRINDQNIVDIIGTDSSEKLISKGITTWFQLIGIAMTFRTKNQDTGLISSDQWFDKICEYLEAFNITNPVVIATAATIYISTFIII